MEIATDGLLASDFRIVSDERFQGGASRWRRFGEPVPAGQSIKADGTPDYGLFGPGSQVWEILLHPATIIFESIGQSLLQLTYKPIAAGIRDHDPISRKARSGTLTVFDAFERFQRNSGMHAPMWLGDTETAEKMAAHLNRVHKRVVSDIIDVSAPELGGYDATGPREAMWAALTEMDAILRVYEGFAFHGSQPPHRLTQEQRDQYFLECGAYLRLVGVPEAEIPTSETEVDTLYQKYAKFFGHSKTIHIFPDTGEDSRELSQAIMAKNFHPSQTGAMQMLRTHFGELRMPVLGALPERTRRDSGLSETESAQAVQSLQDALPRIQDMQRGESANEIMRLMWGPDGVALIESARALHREASGGPVGA